MSHTHSYAELMQGPARQNVNYCQEDIQDLPECVCEAGGGGGGGGRARTVLVLS